MHTAIKSVSKKLDTQTEDGSVVAYFLKSARKERSGFSSWPKDRGDYLSFTLYKENKDTSEAVLLLAKMLGYSNYLLKANVFVGLDKKRLRSLERRTKELLQFNEYLLFGWKLPRQGI